MTIDITQFFLGLVLLAFAWVVLDFLFERMIGRIYQWNKRRKIRECHLCGKNYQESSSLKISHCPDCDALNTRKRHRRLG